jgi:phospholipase C
MSALDLVDTIVVLFQENRSFDHMLGYLSLPPYSRTDVEGLSTDPVWLARYANVYGGRSYTPFQLTDKRMPGDPPHDRNWIAVQLGAPNAVGEYPMRDFVTSYAHAPGVEIRDQPEVMGYFMPSEAPLTDFFAQSFAICDHWFAPLPAGTQPNRLMAMSGFTPIENNAGLLVDDQPLVYDWLSEHGVRWRVYHEGIPFFALMKKWWAKIVDPADDHFRVLERLPVDVQKEDPANAPQVIFIEPTYTDVHVGVPSDDHPPTSITRGQELLRKVYRALTANPKRWAKTVFIVSYDEHGGFFDHVSPLPIPTDPPPGASYRRFESTGVRVPAFVASPLVSPRRVFKAPLDHTSILRFLGEKFAGGSYSELVDRRQAGPVALSSVAEVLDLAEPRADIPAPPLPVPYLPSFNENTAAFQRALRDMQRLHPDEVADKFPELWLSDDN